MKLLLIIILVIIIFIFVEYANIDTNNVKSKTWRRCKKSIIDDKLLREALNNNKIRKVDTNYWDFYIPCKLNNKELDNIEIYNNNQKVFVIHNNFLLSSKKVLCMALYNLNGRTASNKIMPKTYIMPDDIKLFTQEHDPNKIYLLKKDIQRQRGIKLVKGKVDDILNDIVDDHVVIQEYDNDTILYNNKKVNLRIYLLVVCNNGVVSGYIYNDGMIYYAPKNYESNSIDFDTAICSFYKSKKLYDKGYPILISDFLKRSYLSHDVLYDKLAKNLAIVMDAVEINICKLDKFKHNTTLQLFGVDFMMNKDGNVKLIEINKGPGMTPYNEIDREMRYGVHNDMLKLIDIVDDESKQKKNGFIKFYEK